MKKRKSKQQYSEEEMKEIVAHAINYTDCKRREEYNRAKNDMLFAESQLVATFDDEQMVLYNKFCKERDNFYNIAKEMYVKIF